MPTPASVRSRAHEKPGRTVTLRTRSFLCLLFASCVSTFGDILVPLAVSFAVLDTLHGTSTQVGVVLGAELVGTTTFILAGGVIADRFPPVRRMVTANVASVVIEMTVAVLLIGGVLTIPLLALLLMLKGAASAFFAPASVALLPSIVSAEGVQKANGLLSTSAAMATVIGPLVGGLLIVATGPAMAIGLDGATFAVSAAALSLIPTQRRTPADLSGRTSAAAGPRARAFIAGLAAGIREIRRRAWLAATVGVSCITALLGAGPLMTAIPIVAHSSLGGVRAYSYIIAALAGGGVMGGLAASLFQTDRPMAVSAIALVGLAAAPLALAIPLPLPGVIVAFLVAGVGQAVGQALCSTCVIRAVPSDAIGRVSAWGSLGSLALRPLGQALGGAVAGAFGVGAVLWGCCAILMAAPVSLAAIRDVRNFRIE